MKNYPAQKKPYQQRKAGKKNKKKYNNETMDFWLKEFVSNLKKNRG